LARRWEEASSDVETAQEQRVWQAHQEQEPSSGQGSAKTPTKIIAEQ